MVRSCADVRFASVKGMTVDDFLGGGFMENDSDDGEVWQELSIDQLTLTICAFSQMSMDQDESDAQEEAEEEDDVADDASFASVDDLEGMSFRRH